MSKQQTAVDWLIKKYHDYGAIYYEDITQAKAMEKEQIIDAATWGALAETGEQYYKEKYNK
jgi:hypothetical protein